MAPVLRPVKDSKGTYTLVEDMETAYGTIPKDFPTDGASIPRLLWSIVDHPFAVKNIRASTIHDWMYDHNYPTKYTRKSADNIFYNTLREDGVSKLKAGTMYLGVRLFGWMFFEKPKRKELKKN